MLKTDLQTLGLIDRGAKYEFKVKIYFQQPEVFTKEDFFSDVGEISGSLSEEGGYEIGNTTIALLNRDFYFSVKFAREFPNNKLCEVFVVIGAAEIVAFRGIISGWTLTQEMLTVNVNA